MYVIAFTPTTGNMLAVVYMDFDVRVNKSLRISDLLLSNSLLVPTGVLQPTPLCQIAYDTLFFPEAGLGSVKSAKNKRSVSVSMSSSARGLTSSKSSSCACGLSSSRSSNKTSACKVARLVRFLRTLQKNVSSHSCNLSSSYIYGRTRVRTRMQLRASRSGANSRSGKEG